MSTWPTFACSYRYDGAEWTFVLKARDHAEAEERLRAIQWAKVDGEIILELPAQLGWLGKLAVAWQNFWRKP